MSGSLVGSRLRRAPVYICGQDPYPHRPFGKGPWHPWILLDRRCRRPEKASGRSSLTLQLLVRDRMSKVPIWAPRPGV
jgi:hypothetical protein